MEKSTRPHVLAVLPGFMPSTLMNVIKPLLVLEREGLIDFRVALENYPNTRAIQWADLLVFCRNSEPLYQYVLDYATKHQKPFIYDIDDNFFELPLDTPLGRYHRHPARIKVLKRFIQNASVVRVYSQPLLKRAQQISDRTRITTPPLDWDLIQEPNDREPESPVRIVYVTSRQDDHLGEVFLPALTRILENYPTKVKICFWGSLPEQFLKLPNIEHRHYRLNYDRFIQEFSAQGFDIGLAPLLDDLFHRSKTNNKFREYGACGIAGIYSNVDVYNTCVEQGVTGLLVNNQPEAWYDALQTLIEEPDLRSRMGTAARKVVKHLYPPGQFEDTWWRQVQYALENPQASQPATLYAAPSDSTDLLTQKQKSILRIWLGKLKRGLMTIFTPGRFGIDSRIHLTNLWWLFKLNILRRL